MGYTATAKLVYGWNLGGPEEGWNLQEADAEGNWTYPEEDGEGPTEHIQATLLRSTGLVTGPYPPHGSSDEEWQRHLGLVKQAETQLVVKAEPECHGNLDFLQYALVAYTQEADWGQTQVIDFAELEARCVAERWDDHLANAIQVLGITPVRPTENWRDLEANPPNLREPIPPAYLLLCEYM